MSSNQTTLVAPTNVNQIMDLMTASITTEWMKNIQKSNLTVSKVRDFVLLVSFLDMKTDFIQWLKSVISWLKDKLVELIGNPEWLSKFKMWAFSLVFFWRRNHNQPTETALIEYTPTPIKSYPITRAFNNSFVIELDVSSIITNCIYNYASKNGRVTPLEDISVTSKDLVDLSFTQTVKDIEWDYTLEDKTIRCQVLNEVHIDFDKDGLPKSSKLNNISQLIPSANDWVEYFKLVHALNNVPPKYVKINPHQCSYDFTNPEFDKLIDKYVSLNIPNLFLPKDKPLTKNEIVAFMSKIPLCKSGNVFKIMHQLHGFFLPKTASRGLLFQTCPAITLVYCHLINYYSKIYKFDDEYSMIFFETVILIGAREHPKLSTSQTKPCLENIFLSAAKDGQTYQIESTSTANFTFTVPYLIGIDLRESTDTVLQKILHTMTTLFNSCRLPILTILPYTKNIDSLQPVDLSVLFVKDLNSSTPSTTSTIAPATTPTSTPTTTPTNKLKMLLSSPTLNPTQMFDLFNKHFQNDIMIVTRKTKHIEMYHITYKETITKETKPNPEFEQWQRRKKQLTDLISESASSTTSAEESKTPDTSTSSSIMKHPALLDHMSIIPPDTIEVVDVKKTLDTKWIKKTSKSLNTLYLRRSDKTRLLYILEQFKTMSTMYTEHEISYKLNILLSGKPGTGKSTAIRAIATYLERNIYFVNLKSIKTNRELAEVFEHIQKTCGNGIVIFEDIDCACDIVHTRDDTKTEKTITDVMQMGDDALSLSFLLNLLDGSLCNDGSVFIMTTNYKERLDKALTRVGRVDVDIEMKCCDRYMISEIYRYIVKKELSPEIYGRLEDDKHTPSEVIHHFISCHYNSTSEAELVSRFVIAE
jgi:chaperone BCS1